MPFAVARKYEPDQALDETNVVARASTKKKVKAKVKRLSRKRGEKLYAIDTRPNTKANTKAERSGTVTNGRRIRILGVYEM